MNTKQMQTKQRTRHLESQGSNHLESQGSNHLESPQQAALSVLEQPGQALDAQTRAMLEPRFGHHFADVRVHADGAAARAADEFGARAFAVGQDIVMNAGEYDPRSVSGLELLTHELTHTIQQRGASRHAPLEITEHSSGAEIQARDTRDRVMGGHDAPSIQSGAGLSIAREDSTANRLGQTFSHDGLGLLTGLPAAAADASLLARVGETVNPGALAGLGADLNNAGITRAMQFAGPLSLGYGISGMIDAANGPHNAESAGSFLANGNSALSGGVATMGLVGEGLTLAGATGAGASVSGAAAAMGPVGALAGSFAGGYAIGNELNKHTTIGNYTSDYIGMTSELFGGGDRNWLLDQTESFDQNVAQGNYGSAAIDGLQIGGTAVLGTLGGAATWAGNSIADGASAIGGGIMDAGSAISGAAGDAYGWLNSGVRGIYGM